jgi:glutathione-regulated potassium-efflux system ancillary protein KefC
LELVHFLAPAVYLLLVAIICGFLSKWAGMGAVMGLLVTGIIAGPFTPGPVAFEDVETTRSFTEIGVVLLLFLIGLEMEPGRLLRMARDVFGLGGLQVIVSGLVLASYLHFVFDIPVANALLVGVSLGFSSTALVIQILEERGEIASPQGRTSFSVLLFQDLAVVPVMAIVPVMAGQTQQDGIASGWGVLWAVAAVGALLAMARWTVPWLLDLVARRRDIEAFAAITLLAVLGAAWTMSLAGLPMELGAFLMGMMLSRSEFHYQLIALIQPFKGLMMALFFISVGMSIDIPLFIAHWGELLGAVLAIMTIKAIVLFGLCLAFRKSWRTSLAVGMALSQGGEFGFVVFGLAHRFGLLADQGFLAGLVVVAVSMLATPLAFKLGDFIVHRVEKRTPAGAQTQWEKIDIEHHVIVAGYGRVGQILCTLLQGSHIPYLAFDSDRTKVSVGIKTGHHVYFGDLQDPSFLSSIGLGRARLAALAVDHPPAVRRGVSHIRRLFPHVPLVARVRDLTEAEQVIAMGASVAFPEAIETGLEFGKEVMHRAGVPADEADGLIAAARRDHYKLVRPAVTPEEKKEEA